jgi:multiple sugar transport system permease protein
MTAERQRFLRTLRSNIIFHTVVIALGFVMLYPILWMISNSFKTNSEIFNSFSLIPKTFNLDNYTRGWMYNKSTTFATFFLNSFVYTIIATLGAVLSSSLVAYGFSRIKFRGHGFWYACMFLTLMLPYQVVMVPQFIIFQKIGWVNTLLPLIVPQFGGQAFFIFLMVQFIRGIPHELDQSAMIDGCN